MFPGWRKPQQVSQSEPSLTQESPYGDSVTAFALEPPIYPVHAVSLETAMCMLFVTPCVTIQTQTERDRRARASVTDVSPFQPTPAGH